MLRNGPNGYGRVTKVLHWLTVLLLAAQFAVGLAIDDKAFRDDTRAQIERLEEQEDDAEGAERDRLRDEIERLEEVEDSERDNVVRAALTRPLAWSVPLAHVLLGGAILLIGVIRLVWRRTGLPPWASYLSPSARKLAGLTEKVLLACLFAIPVSGALLLVVGTDWLWLHVTSQFVFLAALAVHIGFAVRYARERHLSRML